MVTAAGGGFTRFGDVAINRWRNDGTADDYGHWIYLKDVRSGRTWSAGHQPVCASADFYHAALCSDAVKISRRDGNIETVTTIVADSDARTEARRVVVTNRSDERATVELTSYQEIVIAPHVSDRGHRAFSNLFVQTEWRPELNSIIAMRRPRSAVDTPTWAGSTVAVASEIEHSISCETDRSIFIGRGRTTRNPVAMAKPGDLSCTVGAVLDPVLALRLTLEIEPGESVQAVFTTYIGKDREETERLAKSYRSPAGVAGLFDEAGEREAQFLGEVKIDAGQAALYQDLAGTLLYSIRPAGRLAAEPDEEPTRDDLLCLGITGEWPIVLATLESESGISRVEELFALQGFWRLKGIASDLVIVSRAKSDDLVERIKSMADDSEEVRLGKPRGVWVFRRESISQKQNDLLESLARIRVDCKNEGLESIGG